MDINVTAADRAIDELIEKRTAEREQAEREAQEWAESERRYALRGAADNRAAWAAFYLAQLRSAEAAREHAADRLARLIDERAG